MKNTPEQLALQHSQAVCQGHAETLAESLQDMQLRGLSLDDYKNLSKADRRLLDQFAYRSTCPRALSACKLSPRQRGGCWRSWRSFSKKWLASQGVPRQRLRPKGNK